MILILGVTASGKGRLAYDLAQSLDAEIISIDSMKVYRRMDIGTAKPPLEARRYIKYHLIDIVEPSDSFSVRAFRDSALHAMEQIKNREKKIIAVGGTALYIKALLYGLFEGPGTDQQIRAELQKRAQADASERETGIDGQDDERRGAAGQQHCRASGIPGSGARSRAGSGSDDGIDHLRERHPRHLSGAPRQGSRGLSRSDCRTRTLWTDREGRARVQAFQGRRPGHHLSHLGLRCMSRLPYGLPDQLLEPAPRSLRLAARRGHGRLLPC